MTFYNFTISRIDDRPVYFMSFRMYLSMTDKHDISTESYTWYSLRTVSCGKCSLANDEDNLRGKCPCRADLANSRIEYMARSLVSSRNTINRPSASCRKILVARGVRDITLARWCSSNTSCHSRLFQRTSILNGSHTGRNAYLSRGETDIIGHHREEKCWLQHVE